jgi:HrpA-like RNA helicase
MTASGKNDDPLDAAGKRFPAFLTGKPAYSADRTAWAAVWSRFPMYADKAKLRALMASLRENNMTIVISGTGSGKTVICPPLALYQLGGQRVAVTIPKRVTALGAASTAARTLDATLGREVGYRYRGAPAGSFDRERTRLVYATDGTLLAQARHDPLFRDYGAVIVDEAHERSVSTDMLLLALKRCMVARPEFRVVVMSATIDPKVFSSYFSPGKLGLVEVAGGTMYPVRRVFASTDSTPDTYLADGIKVAIASIFNSTTAATSAAKKQQTATSAAKRKNALFFVATTREAAQGCKAFRASCKTDCAAVDCTGLYSKQSADTQAAALAPVERPFDRKLMFATNVAESSLTFNELTAVVDGGFELTSTWDAMSHGVRIEKARATRAQIMQRIGRVGRTEPGVAHLLYTQATFDALPAYPKPSILVIDLTEHMLAAIIARGGLAPALADFAALITPPTAAQIASAISLLHFYRLIKVTPTQVPYGKPEEVATMGLHGTVTRHGMLIERTMERLKMSLWNALLVVAGVVYKCPEDAGALASMFEATGGELSSLFLEDPARGKVDLRRVFPSAADKQSDHRSLLNVYRDVFMPLIGTATSGLNKTAARAALTKAGLNYGPWRAVHDRIRSDARTIERIAVHPDVLKECPLYRLRVAGAKTLDRAILAARMYHNVRNGTTTVSPQLVRCPAEPDFAAMPPSGANMVYEQLLESGGRKRFLTITWVPTPKGATGTQAQRVPKSRKIGPSKQRPVK